jgi:hypothetical protein
MEASGAWHLTGRTRKTTTKLSQEIRSEGHYLNLQPPEQEAWALPAQLWCLKWTYLIEGHLQYVMVLRLEVILKVEVTLVSIKLQ